MSLSDRNNADGDDSHRTYRNVMIQHLHNITLRHWDLDLRILGAKALSALVTAGTDTDLDSAIDTEVSGRGNTPWYSAVDQADKHDLFGRSWQYTRWATCPARAGLAPGQVGWPQSESE